MLTFFQKGTEEQLANVLLLDTSANIVRHTIEFLMATERFNSVLF